MAYFHLDTTVLHQLHVELSSLSFSEMDPFSELFFSLHVAISIAVCLADAALLGATQKFRNVAQDNFPPDREGKEWMTLEVSQLRWNQSQSEPVLDSSSYHQLFAA